MFGEDGRQWRQPIEHYEALPVSRNRNIKPSLSFPVTGPHRVSESPETVDSRRCNNSTSNALFLVPRSGTRRKIVRWKTKYAFIEYCIIFCILPKAKDNQ
jgi:hypothetical protein